MNPLFQLIVYTIVFSIIMRAGYEKYYLFLFVALIPWIFFSTCISAGSSCVWAQKDLVNKIYFPREVLPISYVASQLVNMLLSMLVVLAVVVVTGHGVNFVALLCLPLVIIAETLLALGITMITSACAVFLKDISYILNIITMAWQFMSPVMYDYTILGNGPKVKLLYYVNPMAPVLYAYRSIFYWKEIPQVTDLLIPAVEGILLCFIGFGVFGKLKKRFSEVM